MSTTQYLRLVAGASFAIALLFGAPASANAACSAAHINKEKTAYLAELTGVPIPTPGDAMSASTFRLGATFAASHLADIRHDLEACLDSENAGEKRLVVASLTSLVRADEGLMTAGSGHVDDGLLMAEQARDYGHLLMHAARNESKIARGLAYEVVVHANQDIATIRKLPADWGF